MVNATALLSCLGRSHNGSGNVEQRAQLIKAEQFMVVHLSVVSEPNLSIPCLQVGNTAGGLLQPGFVPYQPNVLGHCVRQCTLNRDHRIP